MKLNLFVEQPDITLLEGIMVNKETERSFKNEKVEQELKGLILETIFNDEDSNGLNSFSSKTYLKIMLNKGDILLFDKNKGFYLPRYPVSKIEDAISDITSLKEFNDKEVEYDPKRDENKDI